VSEIEFGMKLASEPKKLYDLAVDFENHKNLFPSQLKSIKIIKEDGTEVITEEILVFNTYFRNTEIHQTTKHIKKFPVIKSEIIDGPFKGSIIHINFKNSEIEDGTDISCEVELKIPLKYKILSNLIKTKYKVILTAMLYKMNNLAING